VDSEPIESNSEPHRTRSALLKYERLSPQSTFMWINRLGKIVTIVSLAIFVVIRFSIALWRIDPSFIEQEVLDFVSVQRQKYSIPSASTSPQSFRPYFQALACSVWCALQVCYKVLLLTLQLCPEPLVSLLLTSSEFMVVLIQEAGFFLQDCALAAWEVGTILRHEL
jgi:hypothetical protein